MLGKRSRSIAHIPSVLSMGSEFPTADIAPSAKQPTETSNSQKSDLSQAPRKIVGFDVKSSLDKNKENKLSTAALTPLQDKQNGSYKPPKPTSGLQRLFYSSRPSLEKNTQQPAGPGDAAALDSPSSIPNKVMDSECCSFELGMANRCKAHSDCCSKFHQRQPKQQSNPIPISHSPLRPLDSKQQNSKDHSCCDTLALVKNLGNSCETHAAKNDKAKKCIFSPLCTSPGTYEGTGHASLRGMDFLEACFFCNRQLGHGRDIFMYRGDKAFCSAECRYQQIVNDERAERTENCSAMALKTGKSVQSRRRNNRSRVFAADTISAA